MGCTLVCPVTLPCRHSKHLPHPPLLQAQARACSGC
jgi:hypothetical protein